MGKTNIEWTRGDDGTLGESWNPVVGCSILSPGCARCYAMRMAARIQAMSPNGSHYDGTTEDSKTGPVWTGKIAVAPERVLLAPLSWKKPRRIFVNSMGDLFHKDVTDDVLDKVFAVMALCPQHTFLPLTKRTERMRQYMAHFDREARWMNAVAELLTRVPALMKVCHPILGRREPWLPLPNVWLGTSAERQQEWDERKEHLAATPAVVRFASFEPLLGPIVEPCRMSGYLNWAIVGGESGPGARPMETKWAQSLRDQCARARVPFFFKQWGAWRSVFESEGPGEINFQTGMRRVGKKRAGRILDGREHNEMPKVQA